MSVMQNFAFDGALVRVVMRECAPWFVGKDVCASLDISDHNQALDALDEDERGACSVPTPGGDQAMVVISEPGVYRLVFRSRKPAAERFKRWLAHDVLPTLRRSGRIDVGAAGDCRPVLTAESTLHKLQLIREARALFGRARAGVLWGQLGLPAVPPPPPTAVDEARVCLSHLLDASPSPGNTVKSLIERALEEDLEAAADLRLSGLRVVSQGAIEGFAVANGHPWLYDAFASTEWSRGRWMRVLRRLPGSSATGTMRLDVRTQSVRATFIPAHYLDEDASAKSAVILTE